MLSFRRALKRRSAWVRALTSALGLGVVLVGVPRTAHAQEGRQTGATPSQVAPSPARQAEDTDQQPAIDEERLSGIVLSGLELPWYYYVLASAIAVGVAFGIFWLVKKLWTPKPSALRLQLDPAIVTFAVLEAGRTATRRVLMTNRAPGAVRVTSLSVSGAGFSPSFC